jgi:hypothetical protein
MSEPTIQQQPQPPDDLEALLVVQAATLLALEAGSAYAATSRLRQILAAFARSANGRWLMAGAHPTTGIPLPAAARDQVVRQLVAELQQASIAVRDLAPLLEQEAEHALAVGVKHAGEQLGLPVDPAKVALDEIAQSLIDATPKAAAAHIARATAMLEQAATGMDLQTAVTEAQRAVTTVDTGSRYLTNHTANDAVRQVAVRRGEQLLWIAERDACVVCLALAGHLADPNEGVGFDETATYGPYHAPEVWPPGMPLMRPPRHPHCRCQVCIWLGAAPGQPSFPERLKHEAARSILKGWSRPSESNRVRLKAAEKLLSTGGRGLPKSVQEEAARSVARGRFTSREVPRYQPKKEHHHV